MLSFDLKRLKLFDKCDVLLSIRQATSNKIIHFCDLSKNRQPVRESAHICRTQGFHPAPWGRCCALLLQNVTCQRDQLDPEVWKLVVNADLLWKASNFSQVTWSYTKKRSRCYPGKMLPLMNTAIEFTVTNNHHIWAYHWHDNSDTWICAFYLIYGHVCDKYLWLLKSPLYWLTGMYQCSCNLVKRGDIPQYHHRFSALICSTAAPIWPKVDNKELRNHV